MFIKKLNIKYKSRSKLMNLIFVCFALSIATPSMHAEGFFDFFNVFKQNKLLTQATNSITTPAMLQAFSPEKSLTAQKISIFNKWSVIGIGLFTLAAATAIVASYYKKWWPFNKEFYTPSEDIKYVDELEKLNDYSRYQSGYLFFTNPKSNNSVDNLSDGLSDKTEESKYFNSYNNDTETKLIIHEFANYDDEAKYNIAKFFAFMPIKRPYFPFMSIDNPITKQYLSNLGWLIYSMWDEYLSTKAEKAGKHLSEFTIKDLINRSTTKGNYLKLTPENLIGLQEEIIKGLAHRYKIHIQIKKEYLISFLKDFLEFIKTDEVGKFIPIVKVTAKYDQCWPKDKNTKLEEVFPVIVVYLPLIPGTNDEKNEFIAKILNSIIDRYKNYKDRDKMALDITPRDNMKINDFLYLAQGDGDMKKDYKYRIRAQTIPENNLYTQDYTFFKGYKFNKKLIKE